MLLEQVYKISKVYADRENVQRKRNGFRIDGVAKFAGLKEQLNSWKTSK
jgi:hypothetical protein